MKSEQIEALDSQFKKAVAYTDIESKIEALRDFVALTNSTNLPKEIKGIMTKRAKCEIEGVLFED